MAKHAAPHLRRVRGAIVNIASTRALSLGPQVRVNCISPGWIETKGAKLRRADHAQHPVGRAGRRHDAEDDLRLAVISR